jgi:cytoskeleton-associated protein 5
VLEAGVVPDWPSIGVFAFFDCRFAKEICDSLVAKCLTGRPKTLEKTQAVFLLWVELEATDAFLDAMEKAVKAKLAKAVVPAIDAMYLAVRYGFCS